MTPYAYPKTLHVRRLNPGPFKDYRTYKPYLRDEFARQCVYCRRPDGPSGQGGFGADHYRPKHSFPQLETTYSNLFYCCNACNSWKGKYWPSLEDEQQGRFVPNPCAHKMFEHLRYNVEKVEGRTVAGKHTVTLLHLDDPDEQKYRAALIVAVEELEKNCGDYKKAIADLMALKSTVDPSTSAAMTNEIMNLTTRLKSIEAALATFR